MSLSTLAAACFLAGLLNCSPRDAGSGPPATIVPPPAAPNAVVRLAYGPAPAQFGDLRLPASPAPAPVVLVLHGGCWQAALTSLNHTAALAEALRREGYATWNVEYRRLGETGGGWPGTFQDAGAALDFVRVLARRYPGRLDTARVVVVGHSAGGHLACWLAARPQLPRGWYAPATSGPTASLPPAPPPFRPAGIVNLDGPPDLRAFEEAGGLFCGGGIGAQLVGGDFQQQPVRWRLASPVSFLPWRVPGRLLVGSDGMMTQRLSQDFLDRARAAGDTATRLVILPATDHSALVNPASGAWPVVRAAIRGLAGPECGGPAPPGTTPRHEGTYGLRVPSPTPAPRFSDADSAQYRQQPHRHYRP